MNPAVKSRTYKMILVALFAALIAVGAFIRVPVPLVPFTMQTFFVILAGMLLSKKLGAASALVYLAVGLIGIPVFTQGGGIGYVLKPSFGYLIGFIVGVKAFTAAVLGGIGSIPGAMLGGVLLGVAETFAAAYISSEYKDIVAFGLLVLILLFRPTGLLGKPEVEKV